MKLEELGKKIKRRWEIAIAACDEPESWRKKEGDVIAFRPAPWKWGKKELDQYLIVTVDSMTRNEMVQLCGPLYEDGETDEDVIMDRNLKRKAKRRYRLPLNIIKNGWLPELDTQKVRDRSLVYQPLKEKGIVIDTAEEVAVFLDRHTQTYKYKQKKAV
ncbi:MAG: hypothetical protein OCU18_03720 [Candidatus Syntrophoarchaeum sp.]|nr:hypothetical protein [Candidatus Syntrophoarchaeum sp.]